MDLLFEPLEGLTRHLLVGGAVGERVGDGHILIVLHHRTLHGEFIQVGIQEGYDPLGEGGGV